MKDAIKRVLFYVGLFAIGFFVVGPLASRLASADETTTPTPGQPFAFKCDGPDFNTTAEGCAQRLMAVCPSGVEVGRVITTPKDVKPTRIIGMARCATVQGTKI